MTELPAFEVIAEGRRLSLTSGTEDGLNEVNKRLEEYGFVSTIKAQVVRGQPIDSLSSLTFPLAVSE